MAKKKDVANVTVARISMMEVPRGLRQIVLEGGIVWIEQDNRAAVGCRCRYSGERRESRD